MAVTQKLDGNLKEPVEEGIEPSCREGAGVVPSELVQPRKSDGPSTGLGNIKKDASGMVKNYKMRRNQNKEEKSDSLSDIDDAEVRGYLNTKKEICYKRILWEAMNGTHTKPKKQKRTSETKKGVSGKKAVKTTEKLDIEKRSSKINYDALKFLNDELGQSSEPAQIIHADSYAHRTGDSPWGNISHGSNNESSYDEDQHNINYSNNETLCDDEGGMYQDYGDEFLIDECFDF